MRLTPGSLRSVRIPCFNTDTTMGEPVLCTLFAAAEDRPCRCDALHFFDAAPSGSLAAILQPDRLPAASRPVEERVFGRCLHSAREIVSIVHRRLIR